MCDLLHICVGGTANVSDPKIQEKLSIIDSLVQERQELLEATDKYSCTPILTDDIHVALLIKLIEKGADIYRSNSSRQILLHKCCHLPQIEYQKLASFLVQNGHGNAFKVRDVGGFTPIRFVVQAHDLESETLSLLSTSGFDLNEVDEHGNSVLMYAVLGNRNSEFIDLLIKHGADWKLNGACERTVIHFAAWHGNLSALEYFLAKGMDINTKCANLSTPLHYAVLGSTQNRSKLELLKFLVDNKADLNARDRKSYTVLHHAVTSPHEQVVEMVEYLMSCGADINAVDEGNCAVMNLAAQNMSPYLYDKLLHAILNTSTRLEAIPDNQGCTFIHWAVLLMEPLKRTLETFAEHWDINCVDTLKWNSVLFLAVQGKRSETCLNHLIQLGADWKKLNAKDLTVLHYAALAGNLEAVKFFIKKGCNVNARDVNGDTVLHTSLSAMNDQQYEIVMELVKNGADLSARNRHFQTCYEYALSLAELGELDERIVNVLNE
ncbi:putative ankyrin repeat protein [Orchesella cincta]|uniref:Putative ankyrin repeat protein n=1 Tax=Orchesella cincta TaxID=48709 RepID=A0A1D2NN82_ORCCI|nr:putative ankyrin repeat protein [Orchesella cincta]